MRRWIFASGAPERLAALRIGLCVVLAVRLSRGLYLELADQPAALFRPISFMRAFSSMPPRPVVLAVQVAGVVCAVAAAVGLRARVTLPVAWAAGVLLGGMTTSLGKVVHNDVLLLLCMVPLLGARTGDAWAPGARARSPAVASGWPVRTAMAVAAGGYFFTGLAKLVESGPAWVTSDNLRWVLYASSDAQARPNSLALFVSDRAWLAHALAALTILIEVGFPLVLVRARAAWLFVPAAVGMHVWIQLAMGLDYTAWIATVLVVFVDWPGVLARARSSRRALALRLSYPRA